MKKSRLNEKLVLASSVKLEFPLNDTLPSIHHTRDRLLAKVFQFRQDTDLHDQVVDADYELLYAYGTFYRPSFLQCPISSIFRR